MTSTIYLASMCDSIFSCKKSSSCRNGSYRTNINSSQDTASQTNPESRHLENTEELLPSSFGAVSADALHSGFSKYKMADAKKKRRKRKSSENEGEDIEKLKHRETL